jgi:putative ABC transport system substrate-binding protein
MSAFIGLLAAVGILLAPTAADAQRPAKVVRIGYLFGTSKSAGLANLEAFRQGLRDVGYVESQHVVIEARWAEGKYERFSEFAAELVRLKVDVIVAPTTPAALAARNETRRIPIVTVAVADPLASGLVASFGRPGGNVTGLTLLPGPEIVGKYLELLKEAAPRVSRVAVLWNPGMQSHPLLLKEAEVPARSLKLVLQPLEARGPGELDNAFAVVARERAGGLVVLPDSMFFNERTRMAALAAKSQVPVMYGLSAHVDAGGLMAYAANLPDLYRRSATYVGKILKGAKPADLPVERPTTFELVINLKAARAIGLTIPRPVLLRADKLIE